VLFLVSFKFHERAYSVIDHYSHDIRGTLTPTALDGLQLSSELGAQDLKDESVRVLIDEGPIKIENNELFSGHIVEGAGYYRGGEV
jgi:hypothetical protein